MTTPMATSWQLVGDLTGAQGDPGEPGAEGTSITGAEVNGSGDLLVTLSTGAEINAGRVKGGDGARLDIGNSVPETDDLPDDPPINSAFYVRADGHLYVYEGDEGAGDGKPGYTDVGRIKGDTGDTGPSGGDGADGADGVSVVGASIDGNRHLIITLSQGAPIDAGVAQGTPGTDGQDGDPGEPGTTVVPYAADDVPDAAQYRVGTVAIGPNGLLKAV